MIEHWIIPCNVKFYDVISHFKKNKTIVWKNMFTIKKGDIAYIYIGKPYGEIKYKCIVIDDNPDESKIAANTYAIQKKKTNNYFSKKEKYIEMELLNKYPEGLFSLENLRENGLGQVQIQARVDRHLKSFLINTENRLLASDKGM